MFYNIILVLHIIMVILVSFNLYYRIRVEYITSKLDDYMKESTNKLLINSKDNINSIVTKDDFNDWHDQLIIDSCITHPYNLFVDYDVIVKSWWILDYKKFIINNG